MVALVLSKPKTWNLRPWPLAKALSREGGTPVGRAKLRRMFSEAIAAGYMARSEKQSHRSGGLWGAYEYFMGMPDDVAAAVAKTSVAILPQAGLPRTAEPHAAEPRAANKPRSHKGKNLQTKESTKPLWVSPQQAASPKGLARRRPTIEGSEIVQHRLAKRLGYGDVENGWLLLSALPDSRRDELTASERAGKLTDDAIASVRAGVVL